VAGAARTALESSPLATAVHSVKVQPLSVALLPS
jgi:hypothetical protein